MGAGGREVVQETLECVLLEISCCTGDTLYLSNYKSQSSCGHAHSQTGTPIGSGSRWEGSAPHLTRSLEKIPGTVESNTASKIHRLGTQ